MNQQDEKIARLSFASVYPHYLTKIEKKGRTREELHMIIQWLTGYSEVEIQSYLSRKASFEDFFREARLPEASNRITGVICGIRVEEIQNPLTKKVRYLDKLVDELAKGRTMEKILRKETA